MAPLRARTELARVHVFDHAVTQRGDGVRTPERSKGSAGRARQRMTQLSRTAVIPQLANSESPRIWHYGLRALYKASSHVVARTANGASSDVVLGELSPSSIT